MRVGFIGLGHVGAKLAGSLLRNGFDLTLRDIDSKAAEPLLAAGGTWAESGRALAEAVEVVITCLPSPAVSAQVMEEEDGVLAGLSEGKIWLEMSSSDEAEVKRGDRRLGVLHLRHRLARDLFQDGRSTVKARQDPRTAPTLQKAIGPAAVQAQRHRLRSVAPSGSRGDTLEIFPAHYEDRAWRVSLFGDEVEAIFEFDPLTGEKTEQRWSRASRSTPTATTSRRARPFSRPRRLIKADLKVRLEEPHPTASCWRPSAWSSARPSTSR